MDLTSLLIGLVIGTAVLAVGLIVYLYFSSRDRHKPNGAQMFSSGIVSSRHVKSVSNVDLENARRELRTHILEKELAANALTRLYEAEVDGRITRTQRDQLSIKYRQQLKSLEDKLGNFELLIEVGGLESLRTELTSLFERKMGQLDGRLDHAKVRLEQVRKPLTPVITRDIPHNKTEEKIEKPVEKEETEVDDQVKALKEEVLDALSRLEQLDIEG